MFFLMRRGVYESVGGWGIMPGMCELCVKSKIITYKVGLGSVIHIRWRAEWDIPLFVLWAMAHLLPIIRGNL
jgi:hypothetical protein